jgi:hypothetical protein
MDFDPMRLFFTTLGRRNHRQRDSSSAHRFRGVVPPKKSKSLNNNAQKKQSTPIMPIPTPTFRLANHPIQAPITANNGANAAILRRSHFLPLKQKKKNKKATSKIIETKKN